MVNKSWHLSDRDLLASADGELPERRTAKIRAHLNECWVCRSRMARLEVTIGDFVNSYHSHFDPQLPPIDGPAACLKARLAQQFPSRSNRLRAFLDELRVRKWPAYAFSCFLVVLVAALLSRQGRTGRFAEHQISSQLSAQTVPDPSLTPGETTPVSKSEVCGANAMTEENSQIPEDLKQAVFAEYGLRNAPRGAYEVDFLITPELGGSVSIRNLWPEPYYSRAWNALVKDVLEDRLHTLVCSGALDLTVAQREIATNWVDAYKKYVRTNNPM
jgi:anti-sigma factor RsiW